MLSKRHGGSDATATAAAWFSSLPITDPRCNNDSCNAFAEGGATSQANISWASQFLYGHYTAWVFGIIIFLFSAHFWWVRIQGALRRRKPASSDLLPAERRPGSLGKLVAAIRYVSYRRAHGRITEWFSMPSLGAGLIIIFSWIAATVMVFAQHPYYRQKRDYGSPPLGVRAGLMAFALIPLTWATSGKVNIITLLTGIGHEKLNLFHRWTAYIMLYLSVIHTIPFIYQELQEGGYKNLHDRWYAPGAMEFTGTPPLGILIGLVILSVPFIRRHMYEVFVQLHIVLAIIYLGLCFWHAMGLQDSWTYLWATVAIYAFHLTVRWFGKTSIFQLGERWFQQAPVSVTELPGNMLRLTIDVQGPWNWEAGQHVFLRFAKLRFLDNHPFTIINMPRSDMNDHETQMSFLVRPRKGVTARIAALARSGEGPFGAIVDGPYGTLIRPRVEHNYDHAVLVAGGGGISGVLPWLHHLSRHIGRPSSSIKTVTLLWAVKSRLHLSWAETEIERCHNGAPVGTVNIKVWVTCESVEGELIQDSAVEVDVEEKGGDPHSCCQSRPSSLLEKARFEGRPNLFKEVPAIVGSERTVVLACGTEGLKNDLSNTVAGLQSKVLNGRAQEIRLHTETFGW